MKSHQTSASSTLEDQELQFMEQSPYIVVGINSPRAKLRVSVLLNIIPEYHVKYISAEDDINDVIDKADLVIGADIAAREAVLRRKPVIVVGDYGFGGLVTPETFRSQYNNCFKGKINGMKDEYFPLEILEGEIRRGLCLTFQELQMMSNRITTFLHNNID